MSKDSPTIYAIVPAGGVGKRMASSKPKQFLQLQGQPILVHTLKALAKYNGIIKYIIPTVDIVYTRKVIKSGAPDLDVKIIKGGKTRQESVTNALKHIKDSEEKPDFILVHDAVRALVQDDMIQKVAEAAVSYGAAIAAVPVKDTLKLAKPPSADGHIGIKHNVSRDHIWRAQTPQVFATDILYEAYDKALADRFEGTDSAGLLERIGKEVTIVPGRRTNLKITTEEDLRMAEAIITSNVIQR